MFTEQELINGEVNASDDMDGMESQIDLMWNEVAKKRVKIFRLFEQHKAEEAIELRETVIELQKELDSLVRSHMIYQKYLTAKNKGKPAKTFTMRSTKEPSSNGQIVQEIPKH